MTLVSPQRLFLITISFTLLFLVALGHLCILQIFEHPFFTDVAHRQYEVVITKHSPRALILDRFGSPLAMNKEVFSAFITPNNLKDKPAVISFLKKQFPNAYERFNKKASSCFMYVKRHLLQKEIDALAEADLVDIRLLREQSRFYPHPSLGNTIGTTDIDNQGLSGLELVFDTQLSGKPSIYRLQKDARSHCYYFEKKTTEVGIEGAPLTTTLNSDLQFITYNTVQKHVEKWGAQEGAALILDPASGDILAMACVPDFNPNLQAPQDLFLTKNRVLTEVREFGSVMKVFTALAALIEKAVTPDEIIDCENRKETYIEGIKITTWKAFGKLTYTDVIRRSNNIGTSKVALRIKNRLYDHLKSYGFGNATNLGFPGEQTGFILAPRFWSKATPLTLSYGYAISATMLQLACGFALIANRGLAVKPRLIISPTNQKWPQLTRVCEAEPVDALRSIITLNREGNTAITGHIPGYEVMGKTGSADLLINKKYDKTRSLYTFAGIVENGTYKRVIVVFIREPRPHKGHLYAADIAVPLFKDIAQQMLVREKITPMTIKEVKG
ncbi:MAG: Peptidoglycan glycosyltransferase [candidate division TM6 bacterium GW2011_GWE2_42_60]|nr:MAG: Peptidoglycan glycosyltransferase [candidate division TM6 bacterium GW2011_GWE2_42_60]HBY05463.1 hypothetical protein [Candidatus Dependentiae bacterium]